MALLGFQLIVTIVVLSLLYRLTSSYSFAKWLLSKRLVRYLHPSQEEVSQMQSNMKKNKKDKSEKPAKEEPKRHRSRKRGKHSGGDNQESENSVQLNADWTLEAGKVHQDDLYLLPYYAEYQWLVDFGVASIFVFVVTECFLFFYPRHEELNLSLVWCSLVAIFTFKTLVSLTGLYFKGDEAIGERSVCIVSACIYFLLSMVVLTGNETFFEFGLQDAYQSFKDSAYSFLEANGMQSASSGPISMLMLKLWLALWCGLIGALFAFPGLRLAQMHKDALKFSEDKPLTQTSLHISFISPLVLVILWIKPIGRTLLTERKWGDHGVLMSTASFETMRIILVLVVAVVRLMAMTTYLQAYLNLAPQRLSRLKKQAGKMKSAQLRTMITGVFYYLCVVALQYIGPILMTVSIVLSMKILGDFSWVGSVSPAKSAVPSVAGDFTLVSLKKIFTPVFFRGVLGFMTWWTCTLWFVTSVIGFAYHSYFST
ncbi:Transmembrane protein [Halotydeus destructor]|nr:Transmembrane protein [Halotydeus destructor]